MEVFFNELSLLPVCNSKDDAIIRIKTLLGTMKELRKLDYTVLRTHHKFLIEEITTNYTFSDFLHDNTINRDLKILLQSIIKSPFIVDDSEEENLFILNQFSTTDHNEVDIIPEGLATAFVYQEPTISLNNHSVWQKTPLKLIVTPENISAYTIEITNFWSIGSVVSWTQQLTNEIPLNSIENIERVFSPNEYQFGEKAMNELINWYYDDIRYQKKIKALLIDIKNNPFVGGIGHTEILKTRDGIASKRIVKKDRITYTYSKELITIHQCKGHYTDK